VGLNHYIEIDEQKGWKIQHGQRGLFDVDPENQGVDNRTVSGGASRGKPKPAKKKRIGGYGPVQKKTEKRSEERKELR